MEALLERQYTISGRVQYVMFRDFAERKAKKLGIVGTVQNLKTGEVLVLAQGTEAELRQYEDYLHTGSLLSSVEKVKREDRKVTKQYTAFKIIYG